MTKSVFCSPSDGASFQESAAEHEGQAGAVRLYKPQSAELRSFSQNLVRKRVRRLFARKLTAKFIKLIKLSFYEKLVFSHLEFIYIVLNKTHFCTLLDSDFFFFKSSTCHDPKYSLTF